MSRRKTGRVTIRDIARRTQLSPITVSRALRGDPAVRPETRERVRQAAERHGYMPNLLAGALASNRSRVIGVIIPTLLDSIFASTVEGIGRVLQRHNYEFILGSSGYDPHAEERVVRTFLHRRVDGFVVPAVGHAQPTRILLERSRLPVVEIGNLPHDPIGLVVGFSNEQASYAATEHLIASGRRNVAYVGGTGGENANGRDRLAGFRRCLAAHGLEVNERLVIEIDYTPRAALPAVDRLATAVGEFDALVVGGELWTPVIALEFARLGIAVPDAVTIIGIGEVEHADFFPTPLSTIAFPRERAGEVAAELVVGLCEDGQATPEVCDLGFELHARASSQLRRTS
jgi:LacI family gluconate utilization system Gnt-I transcriptional repressor